jgi:hypothetical protein
VTGSVMAAAVCLLLCNAVTAAALKTFAAASTALDHLAGGLVLPVRFWTTMHEHIVLMAFVSHSHPTVSYSLPNAKSRPCSSRP